MKRSTVSSSRYLACLVLLLASAAALRAGGDRVAEGKKLIGANAENICLFAHAYSSYGYKDHEYIGHNKTRDGYDELTYKFTVKGNFKTQRMQMSFYFKGGRFEFLRVRDYTTIYEPFKELSKAYLKQLRTQLTSRPVVASNTELLRTVDASNGQDLCELHLKLAQLAMKP